MIPKEVRIKLMEDEYVIQIKNLSFRYERENVLKNIHLNIKKGTYLALIGPNGSGKSTLLKLILGLLKPQSGEIHLFGQPQASFKEWQRIGFVSQKANSFNTGFPATVYEVVASGLTKKIGLFHFIGKKYAPKIKEAIRKVGMEPFIDRNIGDLSGGQQQRVFIARALVSEPDILILDEPTVGVDQKNVASFYNMLEELNTKFHITLILVTHDLRAITNRVNEVACLNKELYFHGSVEQFRLLSDRELSAIFNHEVIAASSQL